MLNPVTVILDRTTAPVASLAERDEFGAITGPLGLFASPLAVVALGERDELGARCTGGPRTATCSQATMSAAETAIAVAETPVDACQADSLRTPAETGVRRPADTSLVAALNPAYPREATRRALAELQRAELVGRPRSDVTAADRVRAHRRRSPLGARTRLTRARSHP